MVSSELAVHVSLACGSVITAESLLPRIGPRSLYEVLVILWYGQGLNPTENTAAIV